MDGVEFMNAGGRGRNGDVLAKFMEWWITEFGEFSISAISEKIGQITSK